MSGNRHVLILYNEPRPGTFHDSDKGVLDEVRAVCDALDALALDHRSASVRRLEDVIAILSGADEQIVFNLVEGLWSSPEDYNYVPSIVTAFGKACTGNQTPGMLLAHDKWWSKGILRTCGLSCPKAVKLEPGEPTPSCLFDGPYIVKPVRSDASEGLDSQNVVASPADLPKILEMVWTTTGQAALVEQFIEGREINVSILWDKDKARVLPIAEIVFQGYGPDIPKIVGYRAKWVPGSFEYENTIPVIPAKLDQETATEIAHASLEACRQLACYDYCRVDIRLDKEFPLSWR
jgi:D-alanine-D-alanine ligase